MQYVDFRKRFAGFYDRIYWKRKSLSHEAEVRAVIQRFDVQEDIGLAISVDIQRLLLSVVPSPFAPRWFTSLIEVDDEAIWCRFNRRPIRTSVGTLLLGRADSDATHMVKESAARCVSLDFCKHAHPCAS